MAEDSLQAKMAKTDRNSVGPTADTRSACSSPEPHDPLAGSTRPRALSSKRFYLRPSNPTPAFESRRSSTKNGTKIGRPQGAINFIDEHEGAEGIGGRMGAARYSLASDTR